MSITDVNENPFPNWVQNYNQGVLNSLAELNANNKANYTQRMANINAQILGGQPGTDQLEIPPVPASYIVVAKDDQGLITQIDKTGPPVCDAIPVETSTLTPKPAPAPNTIEVGHAISGKWFQVGPSDTFPAGMTTPPVPNMDSSDLHTYEKFGAPVGTGWYLQVS